MVTVPENAEPPCLLRETLAETDRINTEDWVNRTAPVPPAWCPAHP
jgi:hypothetical protein